MQSCVPLEQKCTQRCHCSHEFGLTIWKTGAKLYDHLKTYIFQCFPVLFILVWEGNKQ